MRNEECFNSETAMPGIICQSFRMLCKTHDGLSTLVAGMSPKLHGIAEGL